MRRNKSEMLDELKAMLKDALVARSQGGLATHLSRAQGRVDGYMQAVLDAGLATQEELLALVAGSRADAFGPAVGDAASRASAAA